MKYFIQLVALILIFLSICIPALLIDQCCDEKRTFIQSTDGPLMKEAERMALTK